MAMDGRIVGATEDLTRRLFHLNPAYEVEKCSANAKTVTIEVSNGLIPVTCKFPRSFIDSILEGAEISEETLAKFSAGGTEAEESIEEEQEDQEQEEEEVEYEEDNKEGTPEEIKAKKSKVIRRKKK